MKYESQAGDRGRIKMVDTATKLLVITGRYDAGRDTIGEDFGRLVRILEELARRGVEIKMVCADYRKREAQRLTLHGIEVVISPFSIFHLPSFLLTIASVLREDGYQAIFASKDPIFGACGYLFSRLRRIPLIYDLKDNYDTYDMARIPLVKSFNRWLIRHARAVTCVSSGLAEEVRRMRKQGTYVLPNGVALELFQPGNKRVCRDKLGFPLEDQIIAYAGSLDKNRGIEVLVESYLLVAETHPKARLCIAGRGPLRDRVSTLGDKVILLDLPGVEVPTLLNAADVLVLPNPVNEFTKYCFPLKILEYMATNTPIVATNVGCAPELLSDYPDSICEPDNAADMARKIGKALTDRPRCDYRSKLSPYTWDSLAGEFFRIMQLCVTTGKWVGRD